MQPLTIPVSVLQPVNADAGMTRSPSHSATKLVGSGSTQQISFTYVGAWVGLGGRLGNSVVGDGVVGANVRGDGDLDMGASVGSVGCGDVGAREISGGVGAEVGAHVLS